MLMPLEAFRRSEPCGPPPPHRSLPLQRAEVLREAMRKPAAYGVYLAHQVTCMRREIAALRALALSLAALLAVAVAALLRAWRWY